MSPPAWKLVLNFDTNSEYSSRAFKSDVCPCRYCWSKKCGDTSSLRVSDLCSLAGVDSGATSTASLEPPKWKLVLIFAEGSEFSGRLMEAQVCPCRYCWCGKRDTNWLQESDVSTLQKFISPGAADSLTELFGPKESDENGNSSAVVNAETEDANGESDNESANEKNQQKFFKTGDLRSDSDDFGQTEPGSGSIPSASHRQSKRIRFRNIALTNADESQSKKKKLHDQTLTGVEADEETLVRVDVGSRGSKRLAKARVWKNNVPAAKNLKSDGPQTSDAKSSKRRFWCLECVKSFKGRALLDQHLKEHNRTRPFECCLCRARFKLRKECLTHQRTHKDERGRYNCNQCGYSSPIVSGMGVHLRIHSQNKSFRCNECPLAYYQLSNLKVHQKTHSAKNPDLLHSQENKLRNSTPPEVEVAEPSIPQSAQTTRAPSNSKDRPKNQRLWCYECAKSFQGEDALEQHLREHNPTLPFECCLCRLRFETRQKRNNHRITHKSVTGRYKCNKCEYSCEKSFNIEEHMRIHSTEKPFQCDKCDKAFSQFSNCTAHKKVHHSAGDPNPELPQGQLSGEDLKMHQNNVIVLLQEPECVVPISSPSLPTAAEDSLMRSDLQMTRFKREATEVLELKVAINGYTANGAGIEAEIRGKRRKKSVGKPKFETRTKRLRKSSADVASGALLKYDSSASQTHAPNRTIKRPTRTTSKTHSHAKSRPSAKTKRNFNQRLKTSHEDKPLQSFNCSLCNSTFKTMKQKNIHVVKQHKDDEGRYVCNDNGCRYSCNLVSKMVKHMEIHRQKQVYKCAFCQERFIDLNELARHDTKVHFKGPKTNKNHRCDQCSASFNNNANLRRHKLIHTGERPYKCGQCSRTFALHNTLKIHQRTHTGERPYKCNECPRTFTRPYLLNDHKRLHTGELPSRKCKDCSQVFALGQIKGHYKNCHSGTGQQDSNSNPSSNSLKCDQCSKRFRYSSSFRRHIRASLCSTQGSKIEIPEQDLKPQQPEVTTPDLNQQENGPAAATFSDCMKQKLNGSAETLNESRLPSTIKTETGESDLNNREEDPQEPASTESKHHLLGSLTTTKSEACKVTATTKNLYVDELIL